MLLRHRLFSRSVAAVIAHDVGLFGAQSSTRLLSTEINDDVDTSRTKRDRRIRFFVMSDRASDALDLLHRSLFQTPLPTSVPGEVRYLKLPPGAVCNKVLDSAASTNDAALIAKAADIADHLRLQGAIVTPRTQQVLLKALADTRQVERGLQFVDDWMAANINLLEDDDAAQEQPLNMMSALLEAAAEVDDTDAIMAVLSRMARAGLSPSTRTMVSLIRCFMRLGNIDTAHGMLHWMRRSEMEVDDSVYTALMTAPVHLKGSQAKAIVQKAQEAYTDMMEHNIPPSPHFYAAYIATCGRGDDLEAAKDAWEDMVDLGIEPTLKTYNSMMSAYAKVGDVEGALELYAAAKSLGIELDAVAYATLISGLSQAPAEAACVWKDMHKARIRPTSAAVTAYLNILLGSKEGSWQEVQQLLRSLNSPISLCAHALASAVEKQDEIMVCQLLDLMTEINVPHTIGTVSELFTLRARKLEGHKYGWLLLSENTAPSKRQLQLARNTVRKALKAGLADEPGISITILIKEEGSLAGDDFAVVIGLLCTQKEEGGVEKALDVYTSTLTSLGAELRAWALISLLYGALNAPGDTRIPLILRVVGEARKWREDGGSWWWSTRAQKAVLRILEKAPEAEGLQVDGKSIEETLQTFMRRK